MGSVPSPAPGPGEGPDAARAGRLGAAGSWAADSWGGRELGRQGGEMAALSEQEMRVLAFERSWWRSPGAKEQEILDALGMTATRYYQLLNELIDRPEALVFDPALVTRLRRQRAKRYRLRSARPDRTNTDRTNTDRSDTDRADGGSR